MARGDYVRLDEDRSLRRQVLDRDRECGPKKNAKPWERFRRRGKIQNETTNRHLQAPNSIPTQAIVHPLACHPLDVTWRVAENKGEARAEDHHKADHCKEGDGISIEFTHNHPCREDGEDEDLRCLWIPSSDDEADEEAARP
ncbi:unnamed protein product [Fusarium graminearum]|uniref:Uncharacterized protein n=1 Tax=Gibberella zeae TaxID=5518 RepID=A0A4E9EGY4_GIBZA|nr:unnamed protein product [Fusarium graminearum]